MVHIARIVLLLLLGISGIAEPVAQSLYKSVGRDGRIVYSDRPPTDGRIEKTMTFENLPSSTLPASTAANVEQLRRSGVSSSSDLVAPSNAVVLYSAAWCGYCKKAKAYLAGKGIAYQEIDIDTTDGRAAFAKVSAGRGIPLLLADGQRVQGFSASAYDAIFANRN